MVNNIISNLVTKRSSDLNNEDEQEFNTTSSSKFDKLEKEKKRKSIANDECRVCGGPANGYNFDQISCQSCKAFFRRNALRHMPYLKCRYSGSCKITVESRRHCTYCRLKKCFDVKMRKEWIQTEEERYFKKLKRFYKQQTNMKKHFYISNIQTNQNQLIEYKQPIFRMYRNFSSENLTFNDWLLINNITHAYDNSIIDCDTTYINKYSLIDSTLINFLNDEQKMYLSLIKFYKKIPEFQQIDLEDQILLIKCNITHLIHIHHILKDNFIENPNIGLHMSKWINSNFHQQMSKTRHSFDYFIQNPIVLKITLVTLIFLINLSRLPNEQLSFEIINKNLIYQHQNFYITFLWKYLNVIFNEKDAIKAIQCIIFPYLRYQLLMYEMENIIIINQYDSDQFHPLIKSVLRLT